MHLVEERVGTTYLRFSSGFRVVLAISMVSGGTYGGSRIEFRVDLVE